MIRAIIEKGLLRPLNPLPAEYSDGREVNLEFVDDEPGLTPEQLDEWVRRGDELAAELGAEPSRALMAELDQLRAEQKDLMRRKMGLP